MAVVFDLLRAISEYWFRIKNGISWGHILVWKKKVWKGFNRNKHLLVNFAARNLNCVFINASLDKILCGLLVQIDAYVRVLFQCAI